MKTRFLTFLTLFTLLATNVCLVGMETKQDDFDKKEMETNYLEELPAPVLRKIFSNLTLEELSLVLFSGNKNFKETVEPIEGGPAKALFIRNLKNSFREADLYEKARLLVLVSISERSRINDRVKKFVKEKAKVFFEKYPSIIIAEKIVNINICDQLEILGVNLVYLGLLKKCDELNNKPFLDLASNICFTSIIEGKKNFHDNWGEYPEVLHLLLLTLQKEDNLDEYSSKEEYLALLQSEVWKEDNNIKNFLLSNHKPKDIFVENTFSIVLAILASKLGEKDQEFKDAIQSFLENNHRRESHKVFQQVLNNANIWEKDQTFLYILINFFMTISNDNYNSGAKATEYNAKKLDLLFNYLLCNPYLMNGKAQSDPISDLQLLVRSYGRYKNRYIFYEIDETPDALQDLWNDLSLGLS